MPLYQGINPRVSLEAGMTNPVDISDTGKVRNRPISNFSQAHSVYMRFERDNIARSLRNKVVNDIYNLMPPYSQHELDSTGQGWRANFRTGFINSVNDRIAPRLTDAVHQMQFLTNSRVPRKFPDSDTKTQVFQTHITDTIRSWVAWKDFLDQLATEVCYFGYGAAVYTGPYEWRPSTYRQDEMYFDEHSRQHASQLPIFCVRKSYYPHELVDMISEPETNEELGYKVSNIAAAIRAAAQPIVRPNVDLRLLSDIVREGTLYYSFHRTSRIIETVHMFACGYDAKEVDHWWFNRKRDTPAPRSVPRDNLPDDETDEDNDPIGFMMETYENKTMEDFITLFTFETGNMRLFGSKGIGRMLANLDTAINRVRMSMIDSAFISQMIVGVADEATLAKLLPLVRYPFMWLPEGVAALGQQFQTNIDNMMALDNKLVQLAENIAGAYLPDQVDASTQMPETATAEAIDAKREEEIKQGTLNRWWGMCVQMFQAMQRRMINPINMRVAMDIFERQQELDEEGIVMIPSDMYDLMLAVEGDPSEEYEPMPKLSVGDQDAVDMILKMLEDGLSPREIIITAHQRSTEPTQLSSATEKANYEQFYAAQRMNQNPNFDASEMDYIYSIDKIGAARTDQIYIGQNGQTTQLEQSRAQQIEMGPLMSGQPVPVSPKDDHKAHLGVLLPAMRTQIDTMKATPPATISQGEIQSLGNQIQHAQGHAAHMQTGGKGNPKDMAGLDAQIKEAMTTLADIADARQKDIALAQARVQASQAAMMNQPFEPEQTQVQPGGAPPVTRPMLENLQKQRDHAVSKVQRTKE